MNIPPSKSDIGNLICNATVGRFLQTMRPTLAAGGLTTNIAAPVVPPKIAAALALGLLERAEKKLIRTLLYKSAPVIELGAGHGAVSREIAATIDSTQPMLLVEANPRLAPWWYDNLARSSRRNVTFLSAAVSRSESGTVRFAIDAGSLGSHVDAGATDGELVAAYSIGEVIARSGFDRFSLVCDVEGEEYSLLDEPSLDVFSRCESVIVEIHEVANRRVSDLLAFFERTGLRNVATRHRVYGFTRR